MIFMKNKKIIDSWNSIAPDESAEKRMLQAILNKNHNAEYEDHPDEDDVSEIITNEYTVSKGINAKQFTLLYGRFIQRDGTNYRHCLK